MLRVLTLSSFGVWDTKNICYTCCKSLGLYQSAKGGWGAGNLVFILVLTLANGNAPMRDENVPPPASLDGTPDPYLCMCLPGVVGTWGKNSSW